ncbi:hypothetical protein GA8_11620 [Geobacillus sp. A8]|nr:hypothetical protein GA8_11620 [Geobacillus sp. A8]
MGMTPDGEAGRHGWTEKRASAPAPMEKMNLHSGSKDDNGCLSHRDHTWAVVKPGASNDAYSFSPIVGVHSPLPRKRLVQARCGRALFRTQTNNIHADEPPTFQAEEVGCH